MRRNDFKLLYYLRMVLTARQSAETIENIAARIEPIAREKYFLSSNAMPVLSPFAGMGNLGARKKNTAATTNAANATNVTSLFSFPTTLRTRRIAPTRASRVWKHCHKREFKISSRYGNYAAARFAISENDLRAFVERRIGAFAYLILNRVYENHTYRRDREKDSRESKIFSH